MPQITRRDALRGLLALGLVAPSAALFAPAQPAAAQGWPPIWFWDRPNPRLTYLTGLQLWLRADAGLWQNSSFTTPAVVTGDPVGGWQDQSGTSNHATQATASARPTLRLAILAGRPVIRFDGVDDVLLGGALALTNATLFMVFTQRAGAGTNKGGMAWNDAVANDFAAGPTANVATTGGVAVDTLSDEWRGTSSNTRNMAGWTFGTYWINTFTAATSGGNVVKTVYRNGAQVATATEAGSGTSAPTQYALGSRLQPTPGNFGPLDLAELLIYSGLLTTANQRQVEAYLAARYRITVS